MNRRAFLQRFGVGVVGALALAHVPASVVKAIGLEEPARRYACEYLRKVWTEHAKGRGVKGMPRVMHAGRELFDAYESEFIVNERFTVRFADTAPGERVLAFKAARLKCVGSGWRAEVVA